MLVVKTAPTNVKAEGRNADILKFKPGNVYRQGKRDMEGGKSPAGAGEVPPSMSAWGCCSWEACASPGNPGQVMQVTGRWQDGESQT